MAANPLLTASTASFSEEVDELVVSLPKSQPSATVRQGSRTSGIQPWQTKRKSRSSFVIAVTIALIVLFVLICGILFIFLSPPQRSSPQTSVDHPASKVSQDPRISEQPSVCNDRNKLVENLPTMKSIGYLGAGYDKIFANPLPRKGNEDLGYRQSIFDMTNYCGHLTADKHYRLPENVTVRMQVSCKTQFSTEIIETLQSLYTTYDSSYSIGIDLGGSSSDSGTSESDWVVKIIAKALDVAAVAAGLPPVVLALAGPIAKGVTNLLGMSSSSSSSSSSPSNSSGFGVLFGASRDFQETVEEIKTNSKRVIDISARCTVYNAFINSYVHPQLTANFRRAVSELPSDDFIAINPTDESYNRFFAAFGTHVVTGLTMGAAFSDRYFAEEELWSKMESKSTEWKVTLLGNTKKSVCEGDSNKKTPRNSNCKGDSPSDTGLNLKWLDKRSDQEKFHKMVSDKTTYSVGELPPSTLDEREWTNRSFSNPMPVSLKLELILDLLTPQYFPDDQMIHRKRAGLLKALASYCQAILKPSGKIDSCEPKIEIVQKPPLQDNFVCRYWTNMSKVVDVVSKRLKMPPTYFWVLKPTYNHKLYVAFRGKVSRSGGVDPCEQLTKGVMRLATFHTENEMDCITAELQSLEQIRSEIAKSSLFKSVAHFWVGMKRRSSGFVWEDDQSHFTYTKRLLDENNGDYAMLQFKKWWVPKIPKWHYFPHSTSDNNGRPLCEVRADFTTFENLVKWGQSA